jgi:hypothetical protein
MMTPSRAHATIASTNHQEADDMQAFSGPIEVLGVEFDGQARFEGAIADELARLEADGLVRILALLFVHKDASTGELEALDLEADADGEVTDVLGAGDSGAEPSVLLATLGLSRADIQEMAADLAPGAAAGLVLMEHLWARGLHDAIRATSGTPFLEGFLGREASQPQ